MEAKTNPALQPEFKPVAIEYLNDKTALRAGETMKLRFRLTDPGTGEVLAKARGVKVKYFRAPRYGLTELLARSVGDGIYEVEIELNRAGAYYIYVAAPSLGAQYNDLGYLTVMASRAVASSDAAAGENR